MNNKGIKKRKKPSFIRYNSEYLARITSNWRRPKGLHNKVRLKKKGHIKSPAVGYGSPREVFGYYHSKFDYALINSEKDLVNLDKKYVLLSGKLGIKNRILLLKKLKTLDVTILNIKDIEKYINEAEEKLKQNKQKKQTEKQKKEESKKKTEKITTEKEIKELTAEEKLEKEKLEKKKILEKAQ
mgnify:CR=1 FL=1